MDKLIFKVECGEDSYNDDAELIFPIDSFGMHISEFHAKCKRFALALGYHPNVVERMFGEDDLSYLD